MGAQTILQLHRFQLWHVTYIKAQTLDRVTIKTRGAPDPEFLDPAESGSTPDPEILDLAGSRPRPDPNALDPARSGCSMILALPYLLKTAISAPQFEAFGLIVSMNSCQKLQDFYQL